MSFIACLYVCFIHICSFNHPCIHLCLYVYSDELDRLQAARADGAAQHPGPVDGAHGPDRPTAAGGDLAAAGRCLHHRPIDARQLWSVFVEFNY